ncbi:hypothetical protein OIU84_015927 [Salix udensis]|uniref:Uncharacterized protein n=1 Tax=Salix udensis TaxID=889485 RepID=A0AAD6NPU5_9ROSI|nr:hypothetical protein OIU84_015927 [Salix udensis]
MAENHPHNLGFKEESIMVQHAVFALLMDILNNQIQAKYQSMPVSPFETHRRVMSAFFCCSVYIRHRISCRGYTLDEEISPPETCRQYPPLCERPCYSSASNDPCPDFGLHHLHLVVLFICEISTRIMSGSVPVAKPNN